jgi:hypothetical protein
VEAAQATTRPRAVGYGVSRASTSDGYSDTRGHSTWQTRARPGSPRTTSTVQVWGVTGEPDGQGSAFLTGDIPSRIGSLREMAENAPPEAAAFGIGRLAFSEQAEQVQRAAVDELARLRTRQAIKQLELIARSHPNAATRSRAAAALR